MLTITRIIQHGPRVTSSLYALKSKTEQLKREIAVDREPDKWDRHFQSSNVYRLHGE